MKKMDLRWTLRLKRHAGERFAGSSQETSGISTPSTGLNADRQGIDTQSIGASTETHSDHIPIADNDDLYKVRFKKRRGMTKLKRSMRKARRWLNKALAFVGELISNKYATDEKIRMLVSLKVPDEDALEAARRAKEEAKLFRIHREQARVVELQLINVLTNLGFCHRVTHENRTQVKGRVKIMKVDVSPFAYTYHIKSVPYGVKKTDMSQDWVATEIASTIGKKVRHDLDLFGLRYTVEVGSTLSIPNFATFKDFDKMPKNMPPLAFYAGQTTNGAPVYRNLAEAPHMIVAGQTGGGKSNLLNGIICGLISRQPATTLQIILFDLKGGVEFDSFYGIPHLMRIGDDADGIIEYPEQIIPALKAIMDECTKRLAKLKKGKVKNIGEYNRGRHPKNRIPYVIGIFDEYTTARKLAGPEVETLLSTIANISRAAGIHFIIGTQYPKSDVLSTLISVNFPWRIAFNMPPSASQSVLGNWDASGLTPVGRAILQSAEGETYIQTPRITNSTIKNIIDAVKNGDNDIAVNTVDPEEIIEWALNTTGGALNYEAIFNQFSERISKHQVTDLLRSMVKKTFDVNGSLYRVVQPANPAQSRYVELVDGHDVMDEERGTLTRDELVTEEE